MSRVFLFWLLVLLPLHFSWAAVAPYCGHEAELQSRHPGHHEHRHQHEQADRSAQADAGVDTVSNPLAAAEPGKLPGLDLDCGQCHGNCAGLPAPTGGVAAASPAARPATALQGMLRTRAQSPPDRPQWLGLA